MIDSLDEPRRRLVLLDLSGYSQKEIGEKLGLTPAQVRRRLEFERRELARRLAAYRTLPPTASSSAAPA